MNTPGPVGVGIAGLGRSGWDIHAGLLAKLCGKYAIAATFDSAADRLRESSARFGCRTYTGYRVFREDDGVELVVVAVPSHLHAELSVQVLDAERHVVCEKPMAATVREVDRRIRASRRAGRVLTVFQSYRYDPAFRVVRRVVESGILGRIVLARMTSHRFVRRSHWLALKRFGGGSLNNAGSHLLDQALLLFGEERWRLEDDAGPGEAGFTWRCTKPFAMEGRSRSPPKACAATSRSSSAATGNAGCDGTS